MGAPQFVQPRQNRPADGQATLALWLGILSCAACILSLGLLAIFTLLAGIAALMIGLRARRRGAGATGAVLGAAGIVLSLLALVFWVVLVLIGGLAVEFIDLDGWLDLPPVKNPANPDPPII